jgi:hypothetical protein
MEDMVATLQEKRKSVQNFQYSSWSRICDEWLEDILKLTESSVSVPVMSSAQA